MSLLGREGVLGGGWGAVGKHRRELAENGTKPSEMTSRWQRFMVPVSQLLCHKAVPQPRMAYF